MLTVSEWLHNHLIADQTSFVWNLLDTQCKQIHPFNLFFAWNFSTDETFETQFAFNENLHKEIDVIKQKEIEVQKLINANIDKGRFVYSSYINSQLLQLTSRIEYLKQQHHVKIKSVAEQILLSRKNIVWYLLNCRELAQLLIDYGLPLLA